MNIKLMSALAAALGVSALSTLSAATQNAQPISQVAPSYSHVLLASGVEGEVVVKFTITPKGDVVDPVLVKSTDRLLVEPSLAAVRKWKFSPAMKDGVAVSTQALQTLAFVIPELHSEDSTKVAASNSKAASKGGDSTSIN